MNNDASCLVHQIQDNIALHEDVASFRKHALRNLRLKTVGKESHCSPIHRLQFNTTCPQQQALFATVGGNLATVYDNCHMGDYLAVVVQFENKATPHARGGNLSVCEWIKCPHTVEHSQGDAMLAVAGEDPTISIISIVETAVIAQLQVGLTHPRAIPMWLGFF